MDVARIAGIENAKASINKFLDLLFASDEFLHELEEGRLSYKIQCFGRLTEIFGGAAEKTLTIQQLRARGFHASWKAVAFPKDELLKISKVIERISKQCVPNWSIKNVKEGIGASPFSPPFCKKFDVLSFRVDV